MRKILIFLLFLSLFPILVSAQTAGNTIDMVWQGEGYTHPFYKGRTLWTNETTVTILAIPQIQGVTNTSNLYYKWSQNSKVLGPANGVGKNTLTFSDSILSLPQKIKLEILDNENAVLATQTITISPASPELAVYEDNPLYGFMFHREVGNTFDMNESEVTFAAFPLFYSVRDRANPALVYEWRTGGSQAESRSSVTFRAPDNTEGSSEVSLRVSNKNRLIQDKSDRFLVRFGNDNDF